MEVCITMHSPSYTHLTHDMSHCNQIMYSSWYTYLAIIPYNVICSIMICTCGQGNSRHCLKTETSSVVDHLSPAATGGEKMEVSVATSTADSNTYCGKNTMVNISLETFMLVSPFYQTNKKTVFTSVSISAETPI